MGIPQIILIVIYAISTLTIATQHGKPREGEYNIFVSLVADAIVFGLLIWGGFFS